MGWTSTMATHHYSNGRVNVKAEMDSLMNYENSSYKNQVLKSRMVGSIYYAAIQSYDKSKEATEVFAAICKTSTRTSDGMEFGYKCMDETMGPGYYNCPKTILDILTPIDNEYALEWRQKCRETLAMSSLKDIAIGGQIKWINGNGTEKILTKMAPAYQFKTPWFMTSEYTYVPKRRIHEFEIIKKGDLDEN